MIFPNQSGEKTKNNFFNAEYNNVNQNTPHNVQNGDVLFKKRTAHNESDKSNVYRDTSKSGQ